MDCGALDKNSHSLYETVMGESFDRLAPAVREFHRLSGRVHLYGEVQVDPPVTFVAKILSFCLGASTVRSVGALHFELDAAPHEEIWIRRFPNHAMSSRLCFDADGVVEKLGAATLVFGLVEEDGMLKMILRRMAFWGIPCPARLLPDIVAEERGVGRQIHFNVAASIPIFGLVTRYRGYLDLSTAKMMVS